MKSCREKDESVNILKVTFATKIVLQLVGKSLFCLLYQDFFLRKSHSESIEHALKCEPHVNS